MVNITINGRQIKAADGATILNAARAHNIHIPTLCANEEVAPYGACRLCLVEIKTARGRERLVTSCIYLVEEGLTVQTDTERIKKIRRMLLELLLARCPDSEEIQKLAKEAGVARTRFVEQTGNNKCVLCANCARTCEEVVGVSAISLAKRGVEREMTTPFSKDLSDVCIGCGSCSYSCPTGAITMEDIKGTRYIKWPHNSIKFKMRQCSVCGQYWAPEKQIEYVAKTSGTPLSDYDKCPDCRD
ncbi:MAG: 2Fe-2S iron-sulfur cluster-binding protein [Dehalococcoidales bacterium]|jgi:NADH dehydrogenase/NADH:ubiquinone oxidoreductase subunit G